MVERSASSGEEDAEFVLRTRRRTPLSRHNAARSIREAGERAKFGHVTPHVLCRTTGTALAEAHVPEAAAAAMLGHAIETHHAANVKAHRDAIERNRAREALVEIGLDVTAWDSTSEAHGNGRRSTTMADT